MDDGLVNESYIVDKNNPSTILWGNGSTDHRFDMAHNVFYCNDAGNPTGIVDWCHPLFFTNNMKYMFKYVQSHISKDYKMTYQYSTKNKHEQIQRDHGVVVLVKLKDGIKLFDFTDVGDFNDVFGERDGRSIAKVFDGAEPYFAFNTAMLHTSKSYEPIENVIAKYFAVFFMSKSNKYKKDGSVVSSFFIGKANSFIKLFSS